MKNGVEKQVQIIQEKEALLEKIKDEGLLNGLKLDVYEIIAENHGITIGELTAYYKKRYPRAGRGRSDLSKRVSELQQMGAVRYEGKTVCSRTNRQAAVIVATKELPDRSLLPRKAVKIVADAFEPYSIEYTVAASEADMVNPESTPESQPNAVVVTPREALSLLRVLFLALYLLDKVSFLLFFIPGLRKYIERCMLSCSVAIQELSLLPYMD